MCLSTTGLQPLVNKAAERADSVLEGMRRNTCTRKRGINVVVQVAGQVIRLISWGGVGAGHWDNRGVPTLDK